MGRKSLILVYEPTYEYLLTVHAGKRFYGFMESCSRLKIVYDLHLLISISGVGFFARVSNTISIEL